MKPEIAICAVVVVTFFLGGHAFCQLIVANSHSTFDAVWSHISVFGQLTGRSVVLMSTTFARSPRSPLMDSVSTGPASLPLGFAIDLSAKTK